MTERRCSTQADLDAAVAAGDFPVLTGDGDFTIPDSCEGVAVEASSQPRVVAWGSSQPRVVARDSSQPRVEARASSQPRVEAWASSQPRVVARDSSQPRVEAWDSSQPRVVARDSSQPRVVARDSSQPRVEARDSSQPRVEAWDSSQPRVEARDSSQLAVRSTFPLTVKVTGGRVAVNRNSHVTIDGDAGYDVLVDEISDPLDWCGYYGLPIAGDGTVVLYKRVSDEFRSDYNGGLSYVPGVTVEARDWHAEPVCGGGLHLSPHPRLTERYSSGPRLVAVQVEAAGLVPIPSWEADVADKCKAHSCVVLHECDEDGAALPAPEQVAS